MDPSECLWPNQEYFIYSKFEIIYMSYLQNKEYTRLSLKNFEPLLYIKHKLLGSEQENKRMPLLPLTIRIQAKD